MNTYLEKIQNSIISLKEQIVNHKVYGVIDDINDLKIFMQHHVYAVWDFMSLLKALQHNLTCTYVPWFPVGDADTRFLINEIVTGEESDIDSFGNRKSHFEMYLDAMKQCGANISEIEAFITYLQKTGDLNHAFGVAKTPIEAKAFVNFTFDIINSKKDYLQSAVFTFGREDLIPDMFLSIVNDIYQDFPEDISIFKYYLERHIEVDGDHHSNLALQMTANLCGNNEQLWQEAEEATIMALQKRIELWDGAYNQIIKEKVTA